jgi:hypothetical protein
MSFGLIRTAAIACSCFLVFVALAQSILILSTRFRVLMIMLSSWQAYLWSCVLWIISYTVAIRIEYWLVRLKLQ